MKKFNLIDMLNNVDPSRLSYAEWVDVGMALKAEGYTASDWDQWSQHDTERYHPGECWKKWDTFQDSGVTGATITQYAKDQGWQPRKERESGALDWDSTISEESLVVVNQSWLEEREVQEPTVWKPHEQIITYLNALFDSTDYVGYVTDYYEYEDRKVPTKGVYTKTVGSLIEEINKYKDDLGFAIGDYDKEIGAWIRFNPLDGQGVSNDNVTEYRYALVESDTTDISRQNALVRELELPIAMLVHSGKKSLHAIVRIDANSLQQYKERVDYLFDVCMKNGLEIDRGNKNPSRLSRMPGIERNGHKQFIVDQNIGKKSWTEWQEWIESVNDDLPDPESLADVWNNMPEKAPELIHGVLRQGHKMLIAGPSKAGKSYMLINLGISIAEGKQWLGWNCERGKILYVNLELDAPSAFHRFKDVYEAEGYKPDHISNIDIWNLRGKAVPMDKLAPKLIRRAEKENYIAIVIDPIYKVLTGDENSAEDMALFTNQFDKIATELETAVIYCHHHSKGSQGGKRSMDRASGSGVFARDPDAILDLVELEITEGLQRQQQDEAVCKVYEKWFKEKNINYMDEHISRDDLYSVTAMTDHSKRGLKKHLQEVGIETLQAAEDVKRRSAWRIDGTLREFPKFEARNMWFDFPLHKVDESGLLKKAQPEGDSPPWQKGGQATKKTAEDRKKERNEALEEACDSILVDGKADVEELTEVLAKSDRTVRRYVKDHPDYEIEDGLVIKKQRK